MQCALPPSSAPEGRETNDDGNNNNDDDDVDNDDEGLRCHYDAVLCGTGLVQSLVAAALSRAGKSVLHVDGGDHYGELDAVWSLPYLRRLGEEHGHRRQEAPLQCHPNDPPSSAGSAEDRLAVDGEHLWPLLPNGVCESLEIHSVSTRTRQDDYPLEIGSEVSTPFGTGRIQKFVEVCQQDEESGSDATPSCRYASVVIGLEGHDRSLGGTTTTTMHVGIPLTPDNSPSTDASSSQQPTSSSSLHPSLVASHRVVPLAAIQAEAILEHRSRSFALDVTPSLLYCAGPGVQALLESHVSEYLEFKSLNALHWHDEGKLQKVPCSKSDVFGSDLLSPLEKRRLMKFLQLALDFAVLKQEEEEELAAEEAEKAAQDLAPGDDKASPAPASSSVQSLNERRLNQGRSLIRPQNKAVNASDLQTLQDCITRDVSFETYLKSEAKLSDNLASLVQYALSLILSEQQQPDDPKDVPGSRGTTPLSVGMSTLCRHMASLGQFGVTAFLYPLYGSGELPQAFCRSAAVYGATYLLRRRPHAVVVERRGGDNSKIVGVVIDRSSDGEGDVAKVATKRVACDHVVVPRQAMVRIAAVETPHRRRVLRRISILRGKCIGDNPSAQQQQLVIFPPFSVDSQHPYAIHALLLDDHVKVAPTVPCGCTVVHFTTVASDASITERLLGSALEALLKATLGDPAKLSECQEIFHASFSHELDCGRHGEEDDASVALPSGLHVVDRSHAGVAHEVAYEQARAIFRSICPDEEFLKVASKVAEKAFQRQVDDDEAEVLKKAMEMIQASSPNKSEDTE